MSAVMELSKASLWASMDAFLSEFPFDADPQQLVKDLTSAKNDNLPIGVVVRPEFQAVAINALATRIEQHAESLDCYLTETRVIVR